MHILIVHDDAVLRMAIPKALKEDGHRILHASDDAGALKIIRSQDVHMVIADEDLPDMDVFQFCRDIRLRPGHPHVHVILLVKREGKGGQTLALDSGADDFIFKPLDLGELRARVAGGARLLELRKSMDARLQEGAESIRLREAQQQSSRAEQALRVSTEGNAEYFLYSMKLVNGVAVPMIYNEASAAITGFTPFELMQNPPLWFELVIESDRDPMRKHHDRLLKGEEVGPIEYRIRPKDGKVRWILNSPALRKNAQESVIGYSGIVLDLTQRKRLEEQLRHSQKMEGIGLLAGGIAHDFNNLLTGIRNNLALTLFDLGTNHPSVSNLLDAEKAARYGAELVGQLLGVARHSPAVANRSTSLHESIHEVTSILRHLIDSKIEIRCDLDPRLWKIQADPLQINQILMNLCLNAADAMPRGGQITIKTENIKGASAGNSTFRRPSKSDVKGSRDRDWAQVSVTDNGDGMDEKTQSRIFEPFFTSKESGKGTGLGLAIVQSFVSQNEGSIKVFSKPGAGTTFLLRFPRSRETTATVQIPARSEENADPNGEATLFSPFTPQIFAQSTAGNNETILLVEDNELVRNVGQKILTRAGYQVIEACDGVEALQLFDQQRSRIALVVLDLNMPNKSGRETLAGLRSATDDLPILLSSGYSPNFSQQDMKKFGVDGFLQKPYMPGEFLAMVRRAIDGRKFASNGDKKQVQPVMTLN